MTTFLTSALSSLLRPGDAVRTRLETSSSRRLVGLQQLRFVAALLVLVHHVLEEFMVHADLPIAPWVALLGACGVDIFFVISGFVIWRTADGLSAGISASVFLKKRLMRVLPLYWLFLGLILVLCAAGVAFRSVSTSPMSLVSSFLLLPPVGGHGLVIGVAWTLVYELYFYVLCALALCSPHAKSRPLLLVAMLLIVPRLLGAAGMVDVGEYYGNPIVVEFVFGCLIARCSNVLIGSTFVRWSAVAAVAAVAGLVAAAWLLMGDSTANLANDLRWWGWGVPAALLVAACASSLHVPDRFGGRTLAVLGNASYALYLSHVFVMIGLARLLKTGVARDLGMTLSLGLLAIVLAIVLSHVIHVCIEQPAMRWLGRRFGAAAAPGLGS